MSSPSTHRSRPPDTETFALPDRTRRPQAADSGFLHRSTCRPEPPSEESDDGSSDDASSTDNDASSSRPNDSEQDQEPNSSHNTNKRQKTDTSNSSSGSANANARRSKHSSREQRTSGEGSDVESEDDGYVPRRTTTSQERLDPQMPCFITGCKGRDATLSHML